MFFKICQNHVLILCLLTRFVEGFWFRWNIIHVFYLFIQDLDFWRPVTKEETKNNTHTFIINMKRGKKSILNVNKDKNRTIFDKNRLPQFLIAQLKHSKLLSPLSNINLWNLQGWLWKGKKKQYLMLNFTITELQNKMF
jgi:hypothetical protein